MKLGLFIFGGALLTLACGCPGGGKYTPPWGPQQPTAYAEAQKIDAAGKAITSFKAESVMDYWLGKDRVKGTVLVMGKPGAFVRLNALSPAGDSVMADLACDGTNFVMVDFQNNCVLTGPCDADSIAQFLHVSLSPDDFLHLATGTTPIVSGPSGKVSWDANSGHETVELTSDLLGQTIVLDARDGHTDVLSSHVWAGGGGVDWTIENKDFAEVKDDTGKSFRTPGKSRFQSAGQKADLLVDWKDVKVNVDLPPAKFQLTPPTGLPTCGQQQGAPHP